MGLLFCNIHKIVVPFNLPRFCLLGAIVYRSGERRPRNSEGRSCGVDFVVHVVFTLLSNQVWSNTRKTGSLGNYQDQGRLPLSR